MDKTRVTRLLRSINKNLRDLAKETQCQHIGLYLLGDAVSIDDYADIAKPKFNYYNGKYGEDIKINE